MLLSGFARNLYLDHRAEPRVKKFAEFAQLFIRWQVLARKVLMNVAHMLVDRATKDGRLAVSTKVHRFTVDEAL
jgi:hypothetical protein